MTEILRVRGNRPARGKILQAAEVIRKGGLVAFPTETVYGLGASAFNPGAIRRIFEVKGRPRDNPLIVHVADPDRVETLASSFPARAKALACAFWPGPLTIVLKKRDSVPPEATGWGPTVAVRMPAHAVALSLIESAGVPLVAPSANLSGRPSPVIAGHVEEDLAGLIEMILDGGKTTIGMESTVVDFSGRAPRILRPGAVTAEDMEAVIGDAVVPGVDETGPAVPKSPGTKYRHYAPQAKLVLFAPENYREEISGFLAGHRMKNRKIAVIAFKKRHIYRDCLNIYAGCEPLAVAGRLFQIFRSLDALKVDLILAEPYLKEGGLAGMVKDRLLKAAGGKAGLRDEGLIF